ncbi:uncharacterized protein LOC105010897 [Esox lucius]|uniref:uncharacterized protein LOC105010897 n=1 Tax=Esox lucius TaxID=8010 RepID=UPI001476DC56|nr:uncharacterized protein LOC105010897 [Esox lucius]
MGMRRILVPLLLCSALCVGVVSLTINHTSRVRFHTGRRITLPCTKTTLTGVVQYWHTPFGRVQNSSLHFNQEDVVAMQHDGSLQIQSSTPQHSGLYYCLILAGKHTTLTPYLLNTCGQQDGSDKPRRVVRSVLAGQAEEKDVALVSDGVFESAVVASVVVTFLVGFSFGALSRTLLDRCMNRLRSLGQGCRNHGETVRVAFRNNVEPEDDSTLLTVVTMENANSSPPAKPKRSFRGKQSVENTAYLEGCDQEREVKEREKGDRIDRDERSGREGAVGGIDSEEGRKRNDSEERERKEMEEGSEIEEKKQSEIEEGKERSENGELARRSRVIRLYQYDEDGHRYGHLPNPIPTDHPTPQPRQRSLSLTRLSAIMATATASALDPTSAPCPEPGPDQEDLPANSTQRQERAVFQLGI